MMFGFPEQELDLEPRLVAVAKAGWLHRQVSTK